jgi:hypothetical protein
LPTVTEYLTGKRLAAAPGCAPFGRATGRRYAPIAFTNLLLSTGVVKGATYTPELDPAQWQALRGICSGDPKARGIDFEF